MQGWRKKGTVGKSECSLDNSGLVPAKVYAEENGDTEENIVQMIRDGALAGRIRDNVWYVDTALSKSIGTASDKNVAGGDQLLTGIGGWLILPAIGFVLGPIVGVIGLIAALEMYSQVAMAIRRNLCT